MLIKEIKFRDIDKHYFFVENTNNLKKIYKKLHNKNEIYPVLLYGFISHEEGISFRVLGNVIIEDSVSKLESEFTKNSYILRYDFLENTEVKEVSPDITSKIIGTSEIEEEINEFYTNSALLNSRKNTILDAYRDLRLVDDVQFLLLNKTEQQEHVWARIEEEETNGLLKCTLLDKTKKSFQLKPKDKIYLKYVEHPKYKGLMFVRKV